LVKHLQRVNSSFEIGALSNVPKAIKPPETEDKHHIDAALLTRIQKLRTQGTPCYLGTNQERNRANYIKLEMGLAAALDGVFASSDLGILKPDLEFYTRLQNRIRIPASEILSWDDSLENVTAAREAGWNAEVISLSKFGHLRTFHATLKRYGF
jgi:FMN phosphatase YigB (HAD superfamily)